MNDDGLPSDDQVRRIERGVMGRIDARRAMRNRVIASVTAVVLVGGGFGLVSSALRGGSLATSGAASGSGSSSASVVVRCALGAGSDTSGARTVRVPEAGLPQSAVAACTGGSVAYQSADGAAPAKDSPTLGALSTDSPSGVPAPAASALPRAVLCTDADGSLVVLSLSGSASATCVKAGMEPYTP